MLESNIGKMKRDITARKLAIDDRQLMTNSAYIIKM